MKNLIKLQKKSLFTVTYWSSTHNELLNENAFAGIKTDGSVVTWGNASSGGDSSAVTADLSVGVVQIYSNPNSFAALKDGSVVTWGDSDYGGDSSSVEVELSSDVQKIFSNEYSYAALKDDGSVVTWGDSDYGGDSSGVDLASDVTNIVASNGAFLALKSDGSAVVGGDSDYGGETVLDLSSGVTGIYATDAAFAVTKNDLHFEGNTGSVQHWGNSDYGGLNDGSGSWWESGDLDGHMGVTGSGVEQFSTRKAFAALKDDGSIVIWGNSEYGGDHNVGMSDIDSGVTDVKSSAGAFAAILDDLHFEGNTGSVQH